MSYIFEFDGLTVWSPSLAVGRLYVSLASSIENWMSVRSGLVPMAEDFYIVEGPVFRDFVNAILDSQVIGHPVANELVGGFIAVSLELCRRGNLEVTHETESTADIARLREKLSKFMAS